MKVACVLLALALALAVPLVLRAVLPRAFASTPAPVSLARQGDVPAAIAAADAPPAPPPAPPANAVLARPVTIDVSGWPLDRIIATLADQVSLDGGTQTLADGATRRIDTRLEIMPCDAGWPLADAVADHRPLREVLDRLVAQNHCTLLACDRIVLVSRPMAEPIAPLLAQLWTAGPAAFTAISRIAGSGDADAVATLLGALASPEMDALVGKDPIAARTLQERILSGVAYCGGSWQSWLPSGDQLRILGALAPAKAGVIAAFARCRAHAIPVPVFLLYLAGQIGGEQLSKDLTWVASDPAAALPGLTAQSSVAPIALSTERAWAVKALGRAGVRDALPLIRQACTGASAYDVQLAGIMALGECGMPGDADVFASKPLGGAWITGATAYVAAVHLAPERLGPMLGLPGRIHWGAADAFIGYPVAPVLDGVLNSAVSANWWVRWAMWKGTGRLDPAVVDAAIRARGAKGQIAPELEAILARDGDDEALDALVDAMRAATGVFTDVGARRIEDVAQEVAARLPPARQSRALARLRAGLDFSRVGDAALSMLRAQSSPALADELMSHWPEASAQGGGAAPAILRALAHMRQDRARAFIIARLGEPSGASLCRRAFSFEDLADPALRALLIPLLEGRDLELVKAIAVSGTASYAETSGAACMALMRYAKSLTHDDMRRLRANIRCTDGELPGPELDVLRYVQENSADASPCAEDCVDFAYETGMALDVRSGAAWRHR